MEPVEITAGRVHLRPPAPDDVDAVYLACQDPEIQRWTRIPSPYRRADAEFYCLDLAPNGWASGARATFLAVDSVTERLLAAVGLEDIFGGAPEVGYWVAAGARGNGIGTAAVGAVCRWGFGALGLQRITWQAAVGNTGSRRLAEKLGFSIDDTPAAGFEQRGRWVDAWRGELTPTLLRPPQW